MSRSETIDVICSAMVTPTAENVRRHLLALSKAPLGFRGEFSIAYHLATGDAEALPAGLAMHNHGALDRAALIEAVHHARIAIDLEDGAPQAARTARLQSLLATGTPVLAEDGAAARACLPAEALFQTPEALVDRVYALLAHHT